MFKNYKLKIRNFDMKILGIDPGYGRTGWGVIEKQNGGWVHVAHGCIETGSKDPFIDRLSELYL